MIDIEAVIAEVTRLTQGISPIEVLVKHSEDDDAAHGKCVAVFTQFAVVAHADDPIDAIVAALCNLLHYLKTCRAENINAYSIADQQMLESFHRGVVWDLTDHLGDTGVHVRIPASAAAKLNTLLRVREAQEMAPA